MACLRSLFLFFTLYTASAFGLVNWPQQCTLAQRNAIDAAVDEAISIASDVITKLRGFNTQTKQPAFVEGALGPLFQPTDVPKLIELYTSITQIRTTYPVEVLFFCGEAHIRFDTSRNLWVDRAYTYVNSNGDKRGMSFPLSGFADPNASPGSFGSYTTLGYASGGVDISNQGHIYINPSRFASSTRFDTRSFETIRSTGLNPNLNYLDGIKPLSATVFHELLHIVGGTVNAGTGRLNIDDGPSKNTYGYQKCEQLNLDAPLLNPTAPTTVADCITIAAKDFQSIKQSHILEYGYGRPIDAAACQRSSNVKC